ncbi:MAG: DUF3108 domain-containing protein [Oceanococcus sp.]
MIRAALFFCLIGIASLAPAKQLDLFVADFELYRGDSKLGTASVSLEKGEGDCYVHSYTAKPSWLFRWATGSITERSEFCQVGTHLEPRFFRYHRSGVGAGDENFSLSFDPEKRLVTDHNGSEREWPEGGVDRFMVQLEALRLVEGMSFPVEERRLVVTVIDDDRIKQYTLAVTGEETITVPAGTFRTIRVERINDPKKTTRFWVAPELGYRLVKVEQQRRDDPVLGISLKALHPQPDASSEPDAETSAAE